MNTPLKNLIAATGDMAVVSEIVNKEFDADVTGSSRKKNCVQARMALAKILKNRKHSYATIGRLLGKSHATVIHYFRTIEWDIEFDTKFARKYDSCLLEFESKMSGIPKRYLKMKKRIKALSLNDADTEKLLLISDLILQECQTNEEIGEKLSQILQSLKAD